MKHTRQDLKIMQGWSLEEKIKVSQMKILEWYRAYNGQVFIIYDCGVIQTPTSVFREADHRLLCGSVLPYEIPAFHKALEVCGGLEVRPVAISVPGEFREYCRELFGGEMEMAEASHNLFAERTNGRLYKRLVEPYIMGERRL